jgi:hypothetical protein
MKIALRSNGMEQLFEGMLIRIRRFEELLSVFFTCRPYQGLVPNLDKCSANPFSSSTRFTPHDPLFKFHETI